MTTLAMHCHDVDEQHVTNTSCVPLITYVSETDQQRRRVLQNSSHRNDTEEVVDHNSTVEISFDLLAPHLSAFDLANSAVDDLDAGITNQTCTLMLVRHAHALNSTFFDTASVDDAYHYTRARTVTASSFFSPAVVTALASSVTVGTISAVLWSSMMPSGDPLSLVFAVQFISLTSSIDGLPSLYTETYAGAFGWCV
jgi:hypothetical protein